MNIEETINAVENLFHRVTGQSLPAGQTKHTIQPNVDPISLLELRLHELNQLLQDPTVWRSLQPWSPALSVWEGEDRILLRLDLPAVAKENVDISLRGNVLVISGFRQALPQMAGFMPRLNESSVGHFQRVVTLPIENFTPEISSTIKDGVLEITVNKQVAGAAERSKKNGNGKMQ